MKKEMTKEALICFIVSQTVATVCIVSGFIYILFIPGGTMLAFSGWLIALVQVAITWTMLYRAEHVRVAADLFEYLGKIREQREKEDK